MYFAVSNLSSTLNFSRPIGETKYSYKLVIFSESVDGRQMISLGSPSSAKKLELQDYVRLTSLEHIHVFIGFRFVVVQMFCMS